MFAVLALLQLDLFRLEAPAAFTHFPEIASISFFFNRLLSIGFASGIALVYIVRRPPLRGRHDVGAVFVAMYASFVLLALRPVIEFMAIELAPFPAWSVILANVMIAVGAGMAYAIDGLATAFHCFTWGGGGSLFRFDSRHGLASIWPFRTGGKRTLDSGAPVA